MPFVYIYSGAVGRTATRSDATRCRQTTNATRAQSRSTTRLTLSVIVTAYTDDGRIVGLALKPTDRCAPAQILTFPTAYLKNTKYWESGINQIKLETSASVELTQTRHSHSKQLFHGGQISVFLQGGSKSFIRCL